MTLASTLLLKKTGVPQSGGLLYSDGWCSIMLALGSVYTLRRGSGLKEGVLPFSIALSLSPRFESPL